MRAAGTPASRKRSPDHLRPQERRVLRVVRQVQIGKAEERLVANFGDLVFEAVRIQPEGSFSAPLLQELIRLELPFSRSPMLGNEIPSNVSVAGM